MSQAVNPTPSSPISAPPASLWRRLAAMLYDSLLLLGITFVFGALAAGLKYWLSGDGDLTQGLGAWLFRAGLLIVICGFFLFFWRRGGQTLGMRAWRLQLVNAQGNPATLKQMLARCALAPVSLLLLGVGYWWCLFDRNNLTAHDHLTHSLIVLLPKPDQPPAQ